MAKKVNKKDIASVKATAYRRYLIIDECLRNTSWNGWTIQELRAKITKELNGETGPVPRQIDGIGYDEDMSEISTRQLQIDLHNMEDCFKTNISYKKEGRLYRYYYEDADFSIRNMPISSLEAMHLNSVLRMLSRFKWLPQEQWITETIEHLESFSMNDEPEKVVEFDVPSDESAAYKNLTLFFSPLYDAVVNKRVIKIKWNSYTAGLQEDSLHPYMLKQYNNRWYIIGLSQNKRDKGEDIIFNVALDRMVPYSDESLIEYNDKIRFKGNDMDEFYYELIGVTFTKEGPQKIKFKVTDQLKPYIESKPLHLSQTRIREDNTFSITVHINYELRSLIRSHGIGLEVLEPLSLREQMREEYEMLAQKYK